MRGDFRCRIQPKKSEVDRPGFQQNTCSLFRLHTVVVISFVIIFQVRFILVPSYFFVFLFFLQMNTERDTVHCVSK